MKKFARIALTACLLLGIAAQANAVDFKLNTPPAKAGGFTVATKRMSGMFFDFKRCGNLVP